jgi:hypothetical protein
MPDQMQFPSLESPAKQEEYSLRLQGEHLIADNWDVMLIPSMRGKTRFEGKWVVCHRDHLEAYISRVETEIAALNSKVADLESRL